MIVTGINTRIYVKGQTVDPILYIGNTDSSNSVTLTIDVIDKNGTAVVSLANNTVNPNSTITIHLGDSLSTQTLNSEPYIVKVYDTNNIYAYIVILVVDASESTPNHTSGLEPYNVVVWHKDSGLSLDLGKAEVVPYDSNYFTLVYYYDDKTKKGAYVFRDGLNDWNYSKVARRMLVEYTIQFPDTSTMLNYLLHNSYIRNQDVMNTIVSLISKGLYDDVAKLVMLYFTEPLTAVMRVIKVEPDFNNHTITITAIETVGFGWGDLKNRLDGVMTGATLGAVAGFLGTAGCTIATGGACLAVIGGAALLGAIAGYKFLSDDSSGNFSKEVHDHAEQGKYRVIDYYNRDYTTTVNNLYQQGHIDEYAKNILLDIGAKFRDIAVEAIDDVEQTCYKVLKPCNKTKYLALGGIGGIVGSAILLKGAGSSKIILERIR